MARRLTKWQPNLQTTTLIMAGVGFLLGNFPSPGLYEAASLCSELFINLLKLISLPLVFLSIVASCARMENLAMARSLGGRVLTYTVLTTLLAALVALGLFLTIKPAHPLMVSSSPDDAAAQAALSLTQSGSYWQLLRQAIPSHIFEPFLSNNVLGALMLALLVGGAVIHLPAAQRRPLHELFASLFALALQIAQFILVLMPVAVASFIILFLRDIQGGANLQSLALYIVCIVTANLIQAFFVLPSFLLAKGISPRQLARAMAPALTLAFFSKSSAAALPMALQCAEERAGLRPAVTRFSLPLCTTMNMNACAAFILITVLYVASAHGVVFSPGQLAGWVVIASIAAMGNAAVPMGCYFLASSFLAAHQVPLHLLGIILPFYTLLDMLETAINVWSDACVTAMVDQDAEAWQLAGASESIPEAP